MEDSILSLILKIVINMSALISVLKTKKKILHTMLECIYCVVISALPVFVLSCFVVAVNGNENINFLLLFIGLLLGIISLLRTLNILSVDAIMIGFVLNLFLAYILFVYGKCDEEARKRRKAILGVFISLVWLIVVCVRINQYWQDMTQVGLEDMLILFFSAVFTIPTIYGWVKSIPPKLVEPHAERVHDRRDKVIEKYTIAMKESKKLGIQVLDDLKAAIKIMINYSFCYF